MRRDGRGGRRRRRAGKAKWIAGLMIVTVILAGGAVAAGRFLIRDAPWEQPDAILLRYMASIQEKNYNEMYRILDFESSEYISKEDFIKRNANIYEGIQLKNMQVEIIGSRESQDKTYTMVEYRTSFDTAAGEIQFENEARFVKEEDRYGLEWNDGLIFPGLGAADKVKVTTAKAERGDILDRNGRVLAGKGTASSVGIVPGKQAGSIGGPV